MKASRYNRVFKASDGTWLAFNGWTTALAEIEDENIDFLKALLEDPDDVPCDTAEKRDMREALIEGRFLVEEEEDEVATVKADLLRDRFGAERLDITIAPTLDCNFRCDYCYEEHLRVTMSKTVQDALIRWVDSNLGPSQELNVTWYGGEPLLPAAFPVVERLSEEFVKLTEKRGVNYGAHLVTNGFFLEREKLGKLAKLGVQKVQVTLDGPKETHDKRRHLISGRGTFDRIIENMKETCDLARFQLRINVDQRNAMSAIEVVEVLAKEGLLGKVDPYLAQVTFDGAACGNIVELCYSSHSFANTEVEIYREAAKRGLPLSRYPFRVEGAFCTADRLNGYVFSPTGSIFKCWHEVTMNPDKAIGTLLDGQQPFQKVNEDRWLNWDALSKPGCQSCDVLPMCHGGCPLEAMRRPESDTGACEQFKFNLEPLLELRHLHRTPAGGATGPARDVSCR